MAIKVNNWWPPVIFPTIGYRTERYLNNLFSEDIMNYLRNLYNNQNTTAVLTREDWSGMKGGTPQATYLMNRDNQKENFLDHGYIEGARRDYGLVNKAATNLGERRNEEIPVFQTKPDKYKRENLIHVGNKLNVNYHVGLNNLEADFEHPGKFPMALYIDGKTGDVVAKGWDLNDYGNSAGSGGENSTSLKANLLDRYGSPVVVTTGYQPRNKNFEGVSYPQYYVDAEEKKRHPDNIFDMHYLGLDPQVVEYLRDRLGLKQDWGGDNYIWYPEVLDNMYIKGRRNNDDMYGLENR